MEKIPSARDHSGLGSVDIQKASLRFVRESISDLLGHNAGIRREVITGAHGGELGFVPAISALVFTLGPARLPQGARGTRCWGSPRSVFLAGRVHGDGVFGLHVDDGVPRDGDIAERIDERHRIIGHCHSRMHPEDVGQKAGRQPQQHAEPVHSTQHRGDNAYGTQNYRDDRQDQRIARAEGVVREPVCIRSHALHADKKMAIERITTFSPLRLAKDDQTHD